MDAVIISSIAGAAVSLLASYLKNVGEGFAKKAGEKTGETAWAKTKQVYDTIKAKLVSTPEATKVITALEKSPDDQDTQAAVRFHLKNLMKLDEDFAKDLASLLKEASDSGVDTVFHTNIYGDVQKFVQIGNVSGDVNI